MIPIFPEIHHDLNLWPINFFKDRFEIRFSSSCKESERKDKNDNNLGWYKPLKTMQNKGCARFLGGKVECFHIVNQRSILHVQHYVNKRYKLGEQVKKILMLWDDVHLIHYPLNVNSPRQISSNNISPYEKHSKISEKTMPTIWKKTINDIVRQI